MATEEQRFKDATDYVHRAIAVVEHGPLSLSPTLGFLDALAGRYKTETARNELDRIEERWLRATSAAERLRIAREAELLADRVQENVPGAPQDRQRTNLYPGEVPTATPATSYAEEFGRQAESAWSWVKEKGERAGEGLESIGNWLLLGGGVLLAIQIVGLLRDAQRRNARRTHSEINARLVRAATRGE